MKVTISVAVHEIKFQIQQLWKKYELPHCCHDADDRKFFPQDVSQLHNATRICESAGVQPDSIKRILEMIKWVGCTENGNSIPPEIQQTNECHLLIPRWSDRLEAVGCIGVVRCYQYNREIGAPLWKDNDLYDSPRPTSEEEIWKLATPERFEDYLKCERDKIEKRKSTTANKRERSSMISHYYDKLLHVARPPKQLVRNKYLEAIAEESSKEMIKVLLRYGETGVVDEEMQVTINRHLFMLTSTI